jgi:osmotically inducible lipoprotein OsmB
MKTIKATVRKIALPIASAVMVVSLGACADMSRQDKNTAIGAGAGAVTGAVLTNGSALGTVGGAAVGGYIGNKVDH